MKKVRLWQLAIDDAESMESRKARVLRELPAILDSADYVGLPELWISGAFNLAQVSGSAALVDAEFISQLQALVNEAGCILQAGTFPIAASDGRFFNTSHLFQPNQPIVTYRKQHLFGFADGERTVMEDSSDLVITDTAIGKIGQSICYDLRFPELYRELVENQAEAFSLPAGWPSARISHWEVLVCARAIENQAFVFAVNAVGTHAGIQMGGRSAVVNPKGDATFASALTEEVLEELIDPDTVNIWRKEFPVLQDRKK